MFASALAEEIANAIKEHGDFEVIDDCNSTVDGVEFDEDDAVFVITVGS